MLRTWVALTIVAAIAGCSDSSAEADSGPVDALTDTIVSSDSETSGDPSAWLFDPDRLVQIEVEIDPADWDVLRHQTRNAFQVLGGDCLAEPFAKPFTYFPGAIIVDGERVDNVGVRKKGFLGSLSTTRPSLKIKFSEYVQGQKYRSVTRLTLNNNRQDPSKIRQCLGYELFRAAGVAAPRCNLAHVKVNGVSLGIYSNVESIKKPFLTRAFGDDSGDLYEGTLSDFRDGWLNTFEKKTNASESSTALLDIKAAVEAPDAELVSQLDALIDVDAFITFWAMEVITAQGDGYANNTNNFYFYDSPQQQKFFFIPWGIDGGMRNPGASVVFARGVIARRLYLLPATQATYLARLDQLLTAHWDEVALLARADHFAGLAQPIAITEENQKFIAEVANVKTFLSMREEKLREMLVAPPTWEQPLRDPPCFQQTGTIQLSFDTTWGTIEQDPMTAGTGTFNATLNQQTFVPDVVGSRAGDAGEFVIQVVGAFADGSVAVAHLRLLPQDFVPGQVELGGERLGQLLFKSPTAEDFSEVGFITTGTLMLEQAATNTGAVIKGSLQGEIGNFNF